MSDDSATGPTRLWLTRHGESLANVSATAADRAGAEVIEVDHRDADVPLSPAGEQQADALGAWLTDHRDELADAQLWCSPYLRAQQTIGIALRRAGVEMPVRVDERLRDRELGILDLLTSRGVERRHPDEAARRRWLGKFYYRPPGGESWSDVALRLRSLMGDLERAPGLVFITAHDAVVMLMLYLCLGFSERELLDFARGNTVANASITVLSRSSDAPAGWTLDTFSTVEHLSAVGAPRTEHQGDRDVHPH